MSEKRKLVIGWKAVGASPLTLHITVATYHRVVRVAVGEVECAASYGEGQGGVVDAAFAAARKLADALRERSPGPWGAVLVGGVIVTMGGLHAEDVGLVALAARNGLMAGVDGE